MRKFIFKIFLLIILSLLIGFALDIFSSKGLRKLHDDDYHDLNMLLSNNLSEDIIIVGSSRAWNHFNPEIIDSVTGLSSRVIGLSGAGSYMQKVLWEGFLKSDKIEGKTLVHVLGALETGKREDGIFKKYKFLPFFKYETVYDNLKHIQADLWKEKFIPFYKYHGYPEYLFKGIASYMGFSRTSYNKYKGFRSFNNIWDGSMDISSYEISEEDINLTTRLLKEEINLANKMNVKLVYVFAPEHNSLEGIVINRNSLLKQIEKITIKNDSVYFFDYSDWRLNKEKQYFSNATHLNSEGANKFSYDFSQKLKKDILNND